MVGGHVAGDSCFDGRQLVPPAVELPDLDLLRPDLVGREQSGDVRVPDILPRLAEHAPGPQLQLEQLLNDGAGVHGQPITDHPAMSHDGIADIEQQLLAEARIAFPR